VSRAQADDARFRLDASCRSSLRLSLDPFLGLSCRPLGSSWAPIP